MKKILLALLITLIISCETPQLEYYVPVETTYIGYQLEMKHEINTDRIAHGLDTLASEKKLTEIAKDYAIILNATGVYNHRFIMQRFIDSGAKHFGEVIAVNYYTAASEMSAFQTSPSHINVLRNPTFKYVGIYKDGLCLYICLASYYNN
jgi:uncharacterized protein YkwD